MQLAYSEPGAPAPATANDGGALDGPAALNPCLALGPRAGATIPLGAILPFDNPRDTESSPRQILDATRFMRGETRIWDSRLRVAGRKKQRLRVRKISRAV